LPEYVTSPVPVIAFLPLQRIVKRVVLPARCRSVILQSSFLSLGSGSSCTAPLGLQNWLVCAGIAIGMPGISIFVEISQSSSLPAACRDGAARLAARTRVRRSEAFFTVFSLCFVVSAATARRQ